MSFLIKLTNNSSELFSKFFPPIPLDDANYEIALLSFDTYNMIPNIDESNNAVYFGNDQVIYIPKGTYEVDAILKYMQERINEFHHVFVYNSNTNTFKTSIKCSVDIDFSKPHSVGPLLGFKNRFLQANIQHTSDGIPDISGVRKINVECNITRGTYTNGVPSRTLYSFSSKVGAGYKIQQVPKDRVYLPVDVDQLERLYVKVVDQTGRLVNFLDEEITVELHIRKSTT
jgi:hypothetical protein